MTARLKKRAFLNYETARPVQSGSGVGDVFEWLKLID
jgi:hypothetical protein